MMKWKRLPVLLSLKAYQGYFDYIQIVMKIMLRERRVTSLSNDHPENRNHASRFHGSRFWSEAVTIHMTLRVREKCTASVHFFAL